MASIRRLDTTNISSADRDLPGVGGSSIRSSKANLEKSKTFREARESQPVSSNALGGGSIHHSDRPSLSSVLYIESINLGDSKSVRQFELRRVINAAAGSQTEDATLGKLQSKPLESCSADDVKRVRSGLEENAQWSRERVGHLSDAMSKLDRYLQSRKRNRSDSSVHGRLPPPVLAQRPRPLPILAKGGHRAVSENVDINPPPKDIVMAESGIINKRARTSVTDARVEGRPSSLVLQQSPGVKERERESFRPTSSLISPSKGKERTPVASPGGWEKTKMKGRRSATIKPEASVVSVANGFLDGEREQKGNAQPHRFNVENRSRPSEAHGFRSGPVHGITSLQKSQSASQVHGSSVRGRNILESNGAVPSGPKGNRNCLNVKGGAKLISREEDVAARPNVTIKAKGARAPRSNLVAGVYQSATSSRSSCLTDGQDLKTPQASVKSQIPSGNVNRKRPEPSESSSPPVASWGTSKKMARVARRVNPPPNVSVLCKEETNGVVEVTTSSRDGSGTASSPTPRPLPSMTAGSNLAKRTAAFSIQSRIQSKVGNDRLNTSVGPPNSEDSVGDGQKLKLIKKKEEKFRERKESSPSQKVANVSTTDKKTKVFRKEQIGGGDGVRRQERTGRGSVTPGLLPLPSPVKKMEDAPLHAKFTESARPVVDTKPVGPGRPSTKKGGDLRKALTNPRRVVGNGLGKLSGGDRDDSEHLMKAVQQAVGFSVAACGNDLWRQLEPYFAYVTSDDLSFLHEQLDGSQGISTNKQTQFSDTGSKSLSLTSGITETDGAALTSCMNSEELSRVSSPIRMDEAGASCDKVIPLSQRLWSALIDVDETCGLQQGLNEACQNRDFNSGLLSVSRIGLLSVTRDPEGDTACNIIRTGFERCSFGGTETPYWESSSSIGGQHGRLLGDNQGQSVLSDRYDVYDKDKQLSSSESSDWGEQYRQMSLDDRLLMELRSIGLFPEETPDCSGGEEDDISEELTRLQSQLHEEVCLNKERISKLENAVLANRNAENRAREQLAMNILVETAYKKRMGGRCIKGAAGKGARAAALMFVKRVLTKVQRFESGHSCLSDSLQNLLFRVAPDVGAPTSVVTAEVENEAGVLGTIAAQAISYPDPLSKPAVGNRASRQCEGSERNPLYGLSPTKDWDNYKGGSWPLRSKEREDVDRPTDFRGVNSLSINDLGAAGKEDKSLTKSGPGNVKGERKTKTRPRLKTAKGSLPKPHSDICSLDFASREEVGQTQEAPEEFRNDTDGHIDLSGLPLPGMEDMTAANLDNHQDFASFLDFEDPLPQTDDPWGQGLDIPMDDLTGLIL